MVYQHISRTSHRDNCIAGIDYLILLLSHLQSAVTQKKREKYTGQRLAHAVKDMRGRGTDQRKMDVNYVMLLNSATPGKGKMSRYVCVAPFRMRSDLDRSISLKWVIAIRPSKLTASVSR